MKSVVLKSSSAEACKWLDEGDGLGSWLVGRKGEGLAYDYCWNERERKALKDLS